MEGRSRERTNDGEVSVRKRGGAVEGDLGGDKGPRRLERNERKE